MGFWSFAKSACRVIQDATSLGGTKRLREAKERYQSLVDEYHRLRGRIGEVKAGLADVTKIIKRHIWTCTNNLRAAEKMLNPLKGIHKFEAYSPQSNTSRSLIQRTPDDLIIRKSGDTMDDLTPTLMGVGAGATSVAASWGVVQTVAHASTGTAMAVLHGAAAANAGWAWFGGGSLAAGGGGMAAGHLVLPGIGTAVAIAVSATISHSEASKVETECRKLELVNNDNSIILSDMSSHLCNAGRFERKLRDEGEILVNVVKSVRRKLFRFGVFSHYWRLLNFWISGYYYYRKEQPILEDLNTAVLRFIKAFDGA
jgi:hypothetical protein